MRTAYSGRAAAYEKIGQLEKALADHNMVVMYFAIEVEILDGQDAPDHDKLLAEAAGAYLERSKCQESLGRQKAAEVDRKRGDDLRANAKKLASKAAKAAADELQAGTKKLTSQSANPEKASARHFTIENGWTGPITLTVAGITYRLEAGEEKTIPAPAGSVVGQVQTGAYVQSTTLEAGKAYRIR
jgi:hypothetical protein